MAERPSSFPSRGGIMKYAGIVGRESSAELPVTNEQLLLEIGRRQKVEEELRRREDELQALYEESTKRERLYRSFLASSADGIVIYDMEGRAQYVSPSFTRMFGWTPEELKGRRIPYVPEGELGAAMDLIDKVVGKGIPFSGIETRRYTKDGRVLDVSASASRYCDHRGEPAGMLVILRDISRRKQAQEALRDSEEKFRTLAEAAPFGLVIVAADETTEYLNPKFTEIFGYAIEDVPDVNSWFRIANIDRDRWADAVAVWREETAEIEIYDGIGAEVTPRVIPFRCKDGSEKIIDFREVVLADGRVIAVFLDVTAEVEAQREIVRAKNQWERTFHAVSDLIFITDAHGTIVRINRAMADRLGMTPDEAVGSSCHEPTPTGRSLASLCPDGRRAVEGKVCGLEVFDEALGGVFDLRVSYLSDDDGAFFGSVHVARDITAFKSLERARRLAVHHLCHELTTPLAIIKSSVRNLTDPEISDERRAAKLERIERGLERLADLQSLGREIMGPAEYQPRAFPVQSTLRDILDEVRMAGAHRSVSLLTETDSPQTDIIDPEAFSLVLRTLLKNAIENTPDEGEVLLTLAPHKSGVLLQIEDRGVGIPVWDQAFVFEAFHHTQATELYSTKRPYDFDAGGKGLELMRLRMQAAAGCFDISFTSRRCRFIPTNRDCCPGRISDCRHVRNAEDCLRSGGTTFSVLFRGHSR